MGCAQSRGGGEGEFFSSIDGLLQSMDEGLESVGQALAEKCRVRPRARRARRAAMLMFELVYKLVRRVPVAARPA